MEGDGSLARDKTPSRTGLALALAAAACLAGAGLLLWWREGGDVFARLVTTAFAWCL